MSIKLNGSSAGSVSFDAPADTSPTGTDVTLTLPTSAGSADQVLVTNGSGTLSFESRMPADGPAFRAYSTTSQSISGNTPTKIIFNAEIFDTNACFDSTTNYRFTPTVAGYYQINALVYFQGSAGAYTVIEPYKNGSSYASVNTQRANGNYNAVYWSDVVYFNGSTDYMEIYAFDSVTCSTNTGSGSSHFSAALVRPS